MRRVFRALVCATIIGMTLCIGGLAQDACDMNSDDYTIEDVVLILQAILNGNATTDMDVNFDGKVNLCDVLLGLRIAAGGDANRTLAAAYSTTVATSGANWWGRGVQYPRLLLTSRSAPEPGGTLLATFEELNAGLVSYKPGYPIYRSVDTGKTWEKISFVQDVDSFLQSEWNPHLLELSHPLGDYDAGTILLAGCSIDAAHTTGSAIRLYASTDGGITFGKAISVATGGGLNEGVWEPFLLQLDDGRLVCYYSDDTDPEHSQKIVYKVSSDGVHFGEPMDVVASNIASERPGMPVVTRLGDGTYFMVYEVVDHNTISGNPIFYRTSKDGLDWGDPAFIGTEIVSIDGKALGSAPYCAWTPIGGANGTLIVSGTFMRKGESKTGTDYFISTDCGRTWKTIDHIVPYDSTLDHAGYSNCMVFSADGKTVYALNNPEDAANGDRAKIVFVKAEWK